MAREITLTQGRVAVVDDEDFEKINALKWYAHKSGTRGRKVYAERKARLNGRVHTMRMHRLIMGLPLETDGRFVDHLNGDGLDNRKANLEIVTKEENDRRSKWNERRVSEPCL